MKRKSSMKWAVGLIGGLVSLQVWALATEDLYKKLSPSIYSLYSVNFNDQEMSLRGSAVAVSKDILATNCHVALLDDYIVIQENGKIQRTHLIYKNTEQDLCLLEIPGAHFQSVTLRPTQNVKIGEHVVAMGNPHGTEKTLSQGIVSNKHPARGGSWLQSDAQIYFGSSGGGLFDSDGKLIGITTKMGGNFAFAIPSEWVIVVLHPENAAAQVALRETKGQNSKAQQGLIRIGSFGTGSVELYRNNKECFISLRGHSDGRSNEVTGLAFWNPRYPNGLVIFSDAHNVTSAMSMVKDAAQEGGASKLSGYKSESTLQVEGKAYPLLGTQSAVKKYPFYMVRFNQSLQPQLINPTQFVVDFKDSHLNISHQHVIFNTNGLDYALSLYRTECSQSKVPSMEAKATEYDWRKQ